MGFESGILQVENVQLAVLNLPYPKTVTNHIAFGG